MIILIGCSLYLGLVMYTVDCIKEKQKVSGLRAIFLFWTVTSGSCAIALSLSLLVGASDIAHWIFLFAMLNTLISAMGAFVEGLWNALDN